MAMTEKQKECRKEYRNKERLLWEQVPGTVKALYEKAIAGLKQKEAERLKFWICSEFEDGGEEAAIAHIQKWEQQEQEKLAEKQAETAKQAAETAKQEALLSLVSGQPYNLGAYNLVMAVFRSRLAGKEYAEKRPPLGVRFDNGGSWQLSITPILKSSSTGWQIESIEAELRSDIIVFEQVRPSLEIKARLDPTGTLTLKTRWEDYEFAKRAVEKLQNLLNALAETPEELIRGASHCCICGKALSDGLSMSRGIGPECVKFGDLLLPIRKGDRITA